MNIVNSGREWLTVLLWFLGALVIALACVSYVTELSLIDFFAYAKQVFGWGFAGIFAALMVVGVHACTKIKQQADAIYWWELAQQAGGGVATLALTFTLLGISMGIGSLSDQALSPDTIQDVIGELTKQFSTAFMTTVVGLPAATVLRAWSSIRLRQINHSENEQTEQTT